MLTIPSQAQGSAMAQEAAIAQAAATAQASAQGQAATQSVTTPQSSATSPQRVDYASRYWDSTQETLVGLYGKRDPITGLPTETINDIIHRVADAVAIAEVKYALTPQELLALTLEEALAHPLVMQWRKVFADCIGNQKFWANTPANINADPATSLKVLQYWAHGKLAGLKEDEIWLRSEDLRLAVLSGTSGISEGAKKVSEGKTGVFEGRSSEHEAAMGALAQSLRGTGCLAACGVAYVVDSLEGIQDAARIESLAAKAAMGMGLNTSSLRPWSSIIANGAAASGPDRFYEKTIAKAVEAVAQGGRRGGALIELRNSDHPDILFFIEKKKLTPPPSLSKIFKSELSASKQRAGEDETSHKKRVLAASEQKYGQVYAQYIERQNYLKNTNVTVLAMPGFMEAVESKKFIQASFANKTWAGPVYDPRKPVLDEKGQPKINKLTKELVFEEYSVNLAKFPEALIAARGLSNAVVEISETQVKVKSHFYAPEVFSRIVEGMRDSGEPGIAFYETVNAGNANNHVYELNTCNPCGEQFLPAGPGLDGRTYMGNCNLSSMHAAHNDFWSPDGTYNYAVMRSVCRIQQRFMDNVTDVSWYPIPAQNMTARLERRNGGGFAGIAEYLSRLGVRFGELEASQRVEELFRHYTKASFEASSELARERGVYPLWEGSRYHKKNQRVRNSCMTNNAPTGTLAQALQTSWGVDPHNGVVFSRKVRSRFVDFVAPGFKELMQKHNAWPSTEEGEQALMKQIRANNKSVQGLAPVPDAVQKAYPIRVEVDPEQYIRHLSAIHNGASEYPETFNSVSNTCSIALDSDEEAVARSAMLAWKLGVKDITFYPDGSRLSQPVEKIASKDYQREADLLSQLGHQERRSINAEETTGNTYKVRVGSPEGVSTLHVSLNHEKDRPGQLIEIYARMGKPGAVEAGLFEAVGRLASSFLQYAAEFGEAERIKAEETIVHQLVNIQSGYPAFFKFGDSDKPVVVQSPCDGLAKSIQHYRRHTLAHNRSEAVFNSNQDSNQLDFAAPRNQEQEVTQQPVNAAFLKHSAPTCDKCGSDSAIKIDGCLVCQGCGFSKCG